MRLQKDNVQDFDVRWDQALLSTSEIRETVLEGGLYKSKLQDSVQLHTVFALYDQETIPKNGQPSYHRLKASVRLHIDQMMRTRNFRALNEIVEEQLPKVAKGKGAYVKKKIGRMLSKETHVVSPMILHVETDTRLRRGKANRLLLHPTQRQRLTGKNPSKDQAEEVKVLREERTESVAETKIANTRHVFTWHPSVGQNYQFETGCSHGNNCHLRQQKPSKKVKEEWC